MTTTKTMYVMVVILLHKKTQKGYTQIEYRFQYHA